MSISGIYKIQSKIHPDRYYIGSGGNLRKRWIQHLTKLKQGNHNPKLQSHYNKYGEEDLIFIIIEPCFSEFLVIREQYYIDTLTPFFNIRKIANSNLGIKFSDETKKKLSKSHLGYKHTDEQRRKISEYHTGRKKSPETRLRMSLAQKKQVHSEERCRNNGKAKKGNTFRRGSVLTEETKNKIRVANLGKKVSIETRNKMSESNKIRWDKIRKLKNNVA